MNEGPMRAFRLSQELSRSPEKREVLCEVIYSFTQEETGPKTMCAFLKSNFPVMVWRSVGPK